LPQNECFIAAFKHKSAEVFFAARLGALFFFDFFVRICYVNYSFFSARSDWIRHSVAVDLSADCNQAGNKI